MESIIPWAQSAITRLLPNLDLTPLPSKTRGKL